MRKNCKELQKLLEQFYALDEQDQINRIGSIAPLERIFFQSTICYIKPEVLRDRHPDVYKEAIKVMDKLLALTKYG